MPPVLHRKGVCHMVTYGEFFQFCMVVISIIGLVYQMTKNKK